jgi:hypothetical protein
MNPGPATQTTPNYVNIISSSPQTNLTISTEPVPSRWIYPPDVLTAVSAPGQGSMSIQYLPMWQQMTATRIDALFGWSAGSTTTSNTMAIAMSAWAGIYTNSASSLVSLSTGSTQTTYSYASNNSGQTQILGSAIRAISVPMNMTLYPGEYFVAFNMLTSASSVGAATTALGQTLSVYGGANIASAVNAVPEFTQATASSTNLFGGMGVYATSTTALPAVMSMSDIAQTGSSLSQANIALVFRNI